MELEQIAVKGTDYDLRDSRVTGIDDSPTENSTNVVKSGGIKTYIDTETDKKVDKVTGKGLSTNDYTTAEKTKLSNIEANAQVNVLEGVKVDGTELPITDKKVNIDLSGKVDVAGSETNSDAFVYRQTGGGLNINADNARISSIKGKTLVWNQLIGITNLYSTIEKNGITFTNNDTYYTLNGTSSAPISIALYRQFAQITGHKYFCNVSLPNVSLYANNLGGFQGSITNAGIIVSCTQTGSPQGFNGSIQQGVTFSNEKLYFTCIDLTLMFGFGNEPSTVAEFESMFPLSYYDYNDGTLISNDAEAIETVGFNQWDEEWENGVINADGTKGASNDYWRAKNFIRVIAGQTYYIKGNLQTQIWVAKYDANGNFISREMIVSQKEYCTFTVPSKVGYIIVFMGGSAHYKAPNHDICINLSDLAKNGTYEPYRKSTIQLNLSSFQVRDSQGNVMTIEGGLKSAGTVYDEIDIERKKYIKRIGEVDLGDVSYTIVDTRAGTDSLQNIIKIPASNEIPLNAICSAYSVVARANVSASNYNISCSATGNVDVKNPAFSGKTSAQVKTLLDGVMLYYELATPIEYDLVEPIRTDYPVDRLGTERIISDTVPTPPFLADITYHEANIKDIEIEGITDYLKREELTDELDKLGTIEEGAQVNKIEHIQINGTEQTITNKTVNLPAYPTTLPASDVYAWAKASTKPSYNLSEIGNADDVKAIENLSGTSGFLKKTAANSWSLDTNTYITARDLGEADLLTRINTLAYGIQWNKNSSTCTRIGNPLLHRTLPIQSQMKGCVEKNGEPVYWLDPSNWAYKANGDPSVLDGTDGYVRDYIPKFYGRSWDTEDYSRVMISTVKIDDTWIEIPEHFEDAYKSALDRTNLKLCSIVNTSAQYRGGTNNSTYDSYEAMRSLLGKPATNFSRANARIYASNAGSELLGYNIYKWVFLWLPVIEYANFDLQTAINNNLTAEGYHQGGLGNGATTFSPWGAYNGYNPIIPCGLTNSLGNFSGQVGIDYSAFDSYSAGTVYANRYRGLECPFGDVWTNLDGIIVDANHSDYDLVYTCNDPSKYSDSITSAYINTSRSIHTDGYVKEFDLGNTGEITAISVGGGKADYHYTGSINSTLRTVLAGGVAYYGGSAGPGCLYSIFGVSDSYANIGFRTIKRIY